MLLSLSFPFLKPERRTPFPHTNPWDQCLSSLPHTPIKDARENLETPQTSSERKRFFIVLKQESFSSKGAKIMERSSPSRNTNEEGLLSCWGRFKLKLPWTKRKIRSLGNSITAACRPKQPRPAGGFRYDPLSYAQNFDDSCGDDDTDGALYRGFTSRYAAPSRSVSDE